MKSILVADDNHNIRIFCQQELEAQGYRVLLARDGEEAVRLVHYASVDLAILDVSMPVVGGLEAAQRIRSIAPSMPIVFFTAGGCDRLPSRWSELALGCVEKSDDLSELKQLCAALLRSQDPGLRHDGPANSAVGPESAPAVEWRTAANRCP